MEEKIKLRKGKLDSWIRALALANSKMNRPLIHKFDLKHKILDLLEKISQDIEKEYLLDAKVDEKTSLVNNESAKHFNEDLKNLKEEAESLIKKVKKILGSPEPNTFSIPLIKATIIFSISTLPQDILQHIWSFLNVRDFLALTLVSKQFRLIALETELPKSYLFIKGDYILNIKFLETIRKLNRSLEKQPYSVDLFKLINMRIQNEKVRNNLIQYLNTISVCNIPINSLTYGKNLRGCSDLLKKLLASEKFKTEEKQETLDIAKNIDNKIYNSFENHVNSIGNERIVSLSIFLLLITVTTVIIASLESSYKNSRVPHILAYGIIGLDIILVIAFLRLFVLCLNDRILLTPCAFWHKSERLRKFTALKNEITDKNSNNLMEVVVVHPETLEKKQKSNSNLFFSKLAPDQKYLLEAPQNKINLTERRAQIPSLQLIQNNLI